MVPCPEEQRTFLAAPHGGEFVGKGQSAVGVLKDVGDGEVVGKDRPEESKDCGADGNETGDSGATGGVCEALGRYGRGLTGGEQTQGQNAGQKIVSSEG
jgi:hypothetical protein